MTHIATTPFGRRPVSAGLLAGHILADKAPALPEIDKYAILADLRDARGAFGITDRDLAVLAALMSFHTGRSLQDGDDLVVFPSNKALGARSHGMAESTLRRHLAQLVHSGLILRHDSPNGKRYAVRDRDGVMHSAYGFSLRPLLAQAAAISQAADDARAAEDAARRMRAEVTVALRDAAKLLAYAQETFATEDWQTEENMSCDLRKSLRRKLDGAALGDLHAASVHLAMGIKKRLMRCMGHAETGKMSGKDVQNKRHYQNSKTDYTDSELCSEKSKGEAVSPLPEPDGPNQSEQGTMPLMLVRKACPDLETFADTSISEWSHLISAADKVRPMIGISNDAWQDACRVMGPGQAATTVAAILQRAAHIRSPGGYLRALTRRAEDAAFSPGPMVMALLKAG